LLENGRAALESADDVAVIVRVDAKSGDIERDEGFMVRKSV
jgi:hypothetical protein